MTAEQFYINFEFSDQKVNDDGDLTFDRVVELLEEWENYIIVRKASKEETKKANEQTKAKDKVFVIPETSKKSKYSKIKKDN